MEGEKERDGSTGLSTVHFHTFLGSVATETVTKRSSASRFITATWPFKPQSATILKPQPLYLRHRERSKLYCFLCYRPVTLTLFLGRRKKGERKQNVNQDSERNMMALSSTEKGKVRMGKYGCCFLPSNATHSLTTEVSHLAHFHFPACHDNHLQQKETP